MVCCARILALCDNADLCFVGRSPENLFDHLSGLLSDSSWSRRLQLLQFSWRWVDEDRISSHALAALRTYFETTRLDPWSLACRAHPVAFVDLVDTGETLGNLVAFLCQWAWQQGEDWEAVKRKIRIVGITARSQAGAATWRWQQHAQWVTLVQRRAIKNVSISEQMWYYLAAQQEKVTERYGHRRWGSRVAAVPQYNAKRLQALRLAAWLFDLGRDKEWRHAFARCLSQERAMIYPWFRRLVLELEGMKGPPSSSARRTRRSCPGMSMRTERSIPNAIAKNLKVGCMKYLLARERRTCVGARFIAPGGRVVMPHTGEVCPPTPRRDNEL